MMEPFFFYRTCDKKTGLTPVFFIAESGLFLAVFAFEAIHTTGSINNVLFAGIERVRLAADINAHQRIFFTIGPIRRTSHHGARRRL